MLRHLGAPVTSDPATNTIVVDPAGWNGRLRAAPLTVPGDLSSATFLLVAALTVPGSDVVIENVGLNPTRTGALDALAAMGAELSIEPTGEAMGEPVGRVRARARRLRGTRVAGTVALRAIDEIPALAVAAALADGTTIFSDLEELRIKESDRIRALARELGRAGVKVEERPDGLLIEGLGGHAPRGGTVEPEHDHRIAMAGAVLGLSSPDETLVPAGEIATSFPSFAETLRALGAAL
jgi:3-phosphoshikimate 1-carboxyvinyltransferase